MTPSKEAIEAALHAWFNGEWSGKSAVADEHRRDMQAALAAAYTRDFPQPSKSDEERERVAAWMITKSLATGHGDTIEDMLNEAEAQIRLAEREQWAKVADDFALNQQFYGMQAAHSIAAAIRKGE